MKFIKSKVKAEDYSILFIIASDFKERHVAKLFEVSRNPEMMKSIFGDKSFNIDVR